MRRNIQITIAAVSLLALLAIPAGAQSGNERYRATGGYNGIDVRLPGAGDFLRIAIADGLVEVDGSPRATADGIGLEGVAESVSSAETVANGASVRDPDSGQNCATPTLPGPVGDLVDFGLACSVAEAAIAGNRPAADAAAAAGSLGVNGAFLAEALVELILDPLDDQLAPAITAVQDAVLDPVIEVVAEACNDVAEAVVGSLPANPSDILPQQVQDAIDALGVDVEEPCVILLELLTAPPGVGPLEDVIDRIAEVLAGVLSGLDVVAVELGGGTVGLQTTDGQVIAESDGAALSISLPSIAFLTEALNEVVEQILGDFLTEVEELVAPVADAVAAIPAIGGLVSDLVSNLSLPLLDDEPLLTIRAAASSASATYERDSGDAAATGQPGSVTISMNGALAALLGTDADVVIAAGQSETIAAGTPLESSFSVGTATTSDEPNGGLPGESVTVTGVRLELFTGLEGGVVLDVASATAGAYGVPGTRVDIPVTDLPATGGGLALAALAMTTAAFALRRRP